MFENFPSLSSRKTVYISPEQFDIYIKYEHVSINKSIEQVLKKFQYKYISFRVITCHHIFSVIVYKRCNVLNIDVFNTGFTRFEYIKILEAEIKRITNLHVIVRDKCIINKRFRDIQKGEPKNSGYCVAWSLYFIYSTLIENKKHMYINLYKMTDNQRHDYIVSFWNNLRNCLCDKVNH